MLDKLYENQVRISRGLEKLPRRFLYNRMNYEQHLIGLVGARGVGKTTMLLQHLMEAYGDPVVALYISADHIHVSAIGLYAIAEEHFRNGGQVLCIDEIHKYENWVQEIKNIYDSFPKLKIIISGSSALHLTKYGHDLSRRLLRYYLPGLSFREFINFKLNKDIETVTFQELLLNHTEISTAISSELKVFPLFREYLQSGYYPFWLEGRAEYPLKLQNVLDKIIYEDIAAVFPIKQSGIHQIKRFLYILATSRPFQVNISRLARELMMSRDVLYQYLDYLTRSFVIRQIWYRSSGKAYHRKPEKIFFENPNLLSLLANTGADNTAGVIRETFFVNQVMATRKLYISREVDFEDDTGIHYEVGGRGKKVACSEHLYLIADNIEIGFGNRIPLYLFGFLY